jgi:hypothetical protein
MSRECRDQQRLRSKRSDRKKSSAVLSLMYLHHSGLWLDFVEGKPLPFMRLLQVLPSRKDCYVFTLLLFSDALRGQLWTTGDLETLAEVRLMMIQVLSVRA